MPYIEKEVREKVNKKLNPITGYIRDGYRCTAGDLNYIFTKMILAYIDRKGMSYGTCNDILGVLEGVSKEFYRRKLAPYEDEKIAENGDVY